MNVRMPHLCSRSDVNPPLGELKFLFYISRTLAITYNRIKTFILSQSHVGDRVWNENNDFNGVHDRQRATKTK